MPENRKIYILDPKKISPETIAVAFAKTSRSPESFEQIASELTDTKSAQFHEKWVVGYGHSSVAEHAVLHIALENISRLAVECLESNRLASYTEKSSRYQVWDENHFFVPAELDQSGTLTPYLETSRRIFSNYKTAYRKVHAYLEQRYPQQKDESSGAFAQRLRTTSADGCRYFLPASSLANVGMSINARALEHAIQKMLSHPLQEVQEMGEEIKNVSLQHVPTLVKYANRNDYMVNVREQIIALAKDLPLNSPTANDWCVCTGCDPDAVTRVLAALLYRYSQLSLEQARDSIQSMDERQQQNIADCLLGHRKSHDIPLRELEYGYLGFDLVLDQGAYFELKRHRMMTQTAQAFTPALGYAIPQLLVDAGVSHLFRTTMHDAAQLFHAIAPTFPPAAAYILPNAFNRRVMINMNLRSALHLIKLRSAPNAHFSIRRTAQKIGEIIRRQYPILSPYFQAAAPETSQTITEKYFFDTRVMV